MAPNLITPYLIMLTAYIAQAILLDVTLPYRRHRANAGLGGDAVKQRAKLFPETAVAGDLSGHLRFTRCHRIQSVGDAVRDFLDPRLRK